MHEAAAHTYEICTQRKTENVSVPLYFLKKIVSAGVRVYALYLCMDMSMYACHAPEGGEVEQILTQRGQDGVCISHRKGFVRLAMRHGVAVVPGYCFGCVDAYYTSRYISIVCVAVSFSAVRDASRRRRCSVLRLKVRRARMFRSAR
jgi:hypothetical protein